MYVLDKLHDDVCEEMQDRLSQATSAQDALRGLQVNVLKLDKNFSDGSLFEIAQKAMIDDNTLSIKSKFFLSAKWNATTNMSVLMSEMPLSVAMTPTSTQYVFEGETLAFAAFHDNHEVLDMLYKYGVKNEYLDALIGYELGFLQCSATEKEVYQMPKKVKPTERAKRARRSNTRRGNHKAFEHPAGGNTK